MSDEMKSHLINSFYGAPQTLTDEHRQYLGSLRERTVLRITNKELSNLDTFNCLTNHIDYFKKQQLSFLINGKLNSQVISKYIKLAVSNNFNFTLIDNNNAQTDTSATGLLIVADHAVNHDKITLNTLFKAKDTENTVSTTTEKKGFLANLFH